MHIYKKVPAKQSTLNIYKMIEISSWLEVSYNMINNIYGNQAHTRGSQYISGLDRKECFFDLETVLETDYSHLQGISTQMCHYDPHDLEMR